jgi:hypothetical protein
MLPVRALGRFRLILPVVAVPVCVAALGVGIQAAAFQRPPKDALVATAALRELLRYRVMRATEFVGHGHVRATCVQGWYRVGHRRHLAPGALVLLANGVKLYDLGNGVRRIGRHGLASPLDIARFLLAGCPRFIGGRVGARLLDSRWIDADPGRIGGVSTLKFTFGDRTKPIELFVRRRTYRPVELTLTGPPVSGRSELSPGGGRAAIAPVRRAFHLGSRRASHA